MARSLTSPLVKVWPADVETLLAASTTLFAVLLDGRTALGFRLNLSAATSGRVSTKE